MRKVLVLLLALLVLTATAALPASAKKKKPKPKPSPVKVERTATSDYQAPAIGAAGAGVCFVPTNSCGNLPPGAGEFFIKVSVDDASGTAVAFSVGQDTDPATPGTESDLGLYCGAMETSVAIEPGIPITVFPWLIGLPDCPAFATTGTVTIVFSNLPYGDR